MLTDTRSHPCACPPTDSYLLIVCLVLVGTVHKDFLLLFYGLRSTRVPPKQTFISSTPQRKERRKHGWVGGEVSTGQVSAR